MPQVTLMISDTAGEGAGEGAGAKVLVGGSSGWLWATAGAAAPLTQPLPGWRDIFVTATSPIPLIGGTFFPNGAWDPLLKAAAIAASFATLSGWQNDCDPLPPMVEADDLRQDEEDLAKKGLDLAEQGATRTNEIKAQASDFTPYWANLLSCSAAARPATWSLVLVGLQVGGLLATYFKLKYRRARPAQVWPVISPVIPTPSHPSYPSGHALQSFLIAECVKKAVPPLGPACDTLASRIALNRELAGVHFHSDTEASRRMITPTMSLLVKLDVFNDILETAVGEWDNATIVSPPPVPAPA